MNRIGLASAFWLIITLLAPPDLAAQDSNRGYEIGLRAELALVEGSGIDRFLDARVPAPRLRLGRAYGSVLVEGDLAIRYRTRFAGDAFGALEVLISGLWHPRGPAATGPFAGIGVGLSGEIFQTDAFSRTDLQPVLSGQAGWKHELSDRLYLRPGVFLRRFLKSDALPGLWVYGVELGLSLLLG